MNDIDEFIEEINNLINPDLNIQQIILMRNLLWKSTLALYHYGNRKKNVRRILLIYLKVLLSREFVRTEDINILILIDANDTVGNFNYTQVILVKDPSWSNTSNGNGEPSVQEPDVLGVIILYFLIGNASAVSVSAVVYILIRRKNANTR